MITEVGDQISRVTRARRNVQLAVEIVKDEVYCRSVVLNAPLRADASEYLRVLLSVGIRHVDLVPDPTQERLLDQIRRVQVGREENQTVEWDLQLVSRREP